MTNPQPTQPMYQQIPPVPPAPERRNRGLIYTLIGIGVAVVILIGAGVAVLALNLFQRPSSIPQLLGADTQFYATLTPNLSDVPNVQRLQKAYPQLFVDQDPTEADNQLEELLGVKFSEDIAPWIGTEMAIGIGGMSDISLSGSTLSDEDIEQLAGQAKVTIVLSARDTAKAQAFLDKQRAHREGDNQKFTETTHKNIKIYEQQDSELSPITAFAVVKGHVIFASDAATITAIIDRDGNGSDTLEKNARFTAIKNGLPAEKVGYVFMDGTALSEATSAAIAEQLSLLPAEQASELESQLKNLEALQGIGLSIAIVETGVQFDTAITFDLSKLTEDATAQIEETRKPVDGALLKRIRNDAMVVMTFKIPTTFKDQIMKAIAAQPDGQESLDMFEQQLGFSLEDDLLSWFNGDAALVILPGEELGDVTLPVTGYFTITPADKAAAEAGIKKIIGGMEPMMAGSGVSFISEEIGGAEWQVIQEPSSQQTVGGYGFVEDSLVIAFGNTALEGAASGGKQPITDEATFKTATEKLATSNGGIVYFNIGSIIQVLEENGFDSDIDQQAKDSLKPIKAIAAAGEPGIDQNGVARSRMVIYISE